MSWESGVSSQESAPSLESGVWSLEPEVANLESEVILRSAVPSPVHMSRESWVWSRDLYKKAAVLSPAYRAGSLECRRGQRFSNLPSLLFIIARFALLCGTYELGVWRRKS